MTMHLLFYTYRKKTSFVLYYSNIFYYLCDVFFKVIYPVNDTFPKDWYLIL